MAKRVIEFLRRNLLVMLFLCLIVGQLLIWRTLGMIQENTSHYGGCGSETYHPCYVVVIPNAR